jgi:hypothetical protein
MKLLGVDLLKKRRVPFISFRCSSLFFRASAEVGGERKEHQLAPLVARSKDALLILVPDQIKGAGITTVLVCSPTPVF